MGLYENVFLARQDISPAQVDALVDKFTSLVTEGGGKVTKKENWGLRNITFRIKKNRKAHYVLLNIEAPAAAVQELERNQRINEDVLRYLTVAVEKLEEGPSAIMRRDRDDREFGAPRERGFGDRGFGGRGPRRDREFRRDDGEGEFRARDRDGGEGDRT
jgi:small subunit ribosomal protein S6